MYSLRVEMLKAGLASLFVFALLTSCRRAGPPHVVTVHFEENHDYTPAPVECEIPHFAVLPIKRIPQERSMTCWAASAQMAMLQFQKDVSQCDQVQNQQPFADCPCSNCTASALLPPGKCNNGGWPNFKAFGFVAKRIHGPLPLEDLKREIACRQTPVLFSWRDDAIGRQNSRPGGHMMVAFGFVGDMISVLDPLPTCDLDDDGHLASFDDARQISYEDYVDGTSPLGGHWDDFYAIRPRSAR